MPDQSSFSRYRAVLAVVLSLSVAVPATVTPVAAEGTGFDIALPLAAPAPYRLTLLGGPPRLAVDLAPSAVPERLGPAWRATPRADGQMRLVTALPGPMAVASSAMSGAAAGQGARLDMRMHRVSTDDFAALVPGAAPVRDPSRMLVALDPGHGGQDPGATHGALHEADLMLAFARELKADLLRSTAFDVLLTRDRDRFVPLGARLAAARAAGADVFVSLHADGIESGSASGAAVFTYAHRPSTPETARLAWAHGRGDLFADADTDAAQGTEFAARGTAARWPEPYRSHDLADALVAALASAGIPLYKRPRQHGDFVVLRAAAMPSVLVELGFLTEPVDRARISDPGWRARMAAALRRGLVDWTEREAALAAFDAPGDAP